jgi:hypothetical protein
MFREPVPCTNQFSPYLHSLFKFHFNIILKHSRLLSSQFSSYFQTKFYMHLSSTVCSTCLLSSASRFVHLNNVCCKFAYYEAINYTEMSIPFWLMYRSRLKYERLGWVHTCNVTAYRNTVSWQCGRVSCPRNILKVGYAVTLRAFSVCCRYLVVASKGWYGYNRSMCGRATSRCTSTHAPAVTFSSLWCDGQVPTAHRTSP